MRDDQLRSELAAATATLSRILVHAPTRQQASTSASAGSGYEQRPTRTRILSSIIAMSRRTRHPTPSVAPRRATLTTPTPSVSRGQARLVHGGERETRFRRAECGQEVRLDARPRSTSLPAGDDRFASRTTHRAQLAMTITSGRRWTGLSTDAQSRKRPAALRVRLAGTSRTLHP